MKKRIDWLNHFLEFIVVVIGILLAFQLNTCSANRSQDKVIQTHMKQIVAETEFNETNISLAIEQSELNLKKLDTAFTLFTTKSNYPKLTQICLDLLNLGGFYIKKNAYTSLVESGDIRFMRDLKTKDNVIQLYEYYKWTESFEKLLADDFQDYYYPFIKENFDLVGGKPLPKEVLEGKYFSNLLAAYSHLLKIKLSKYKDCKKEMESFRENINL